MVKLGMLIGDRYEVLEKIGTGGMSDVYKGKDQKLNRFVAIKVLKQEFSENTSFVGKFRIEAQAAAGLMHPNIVNVYDVGDDNGIYYIVMELVEGITLKRYIEKKSRLSVKEALSIAIQVSSGIEAAHNNHIIHRDIKPQNIIISKEGKVKVTDFGIAKAASSNTITSNVMGSVHYTSPEQARGGYSDEKSDVYSLGITLFEMLTGRVPFNGDTTVAIAIKHIQEDMPSPAEFVSDIPISVEKIVLKCTQKSPDRRYQCMADLTDDLKRALVRPNEDFVDLERFDKNGETKAITQSDLNEYQRRNRQENQKRKGGAESQVKELDRHPRPNTSRVDRRTETGVKSENSGMKQAGLPPRRSRPELQSADRRRTEATNTKKEYVSYEDNRYQKSYDTDHSDAQSQSNKKERLITGSMIVLAIAIGITAIILVGNLLGVFGTGNKVKTQVIPVVTGKEYTEAERIIGALGFRVKTEFEESDSVEANQVIRMNVQEGSEVDLEKEIILYISAGSVGVDVPSVEGLSFAEATAELKKQGFRVRQEEVYDDNIQKNNVISQNPAGNTKATRGVEVTLKVSLGSEEVIAAMPGVLNKTVDEARATLVESGYKVNSVVQTYDNTYAAGYICYQSYSEGTEVKKGTGVDLKVSLGPDPSGQNTEQGGGLYRFQGDIKAPTSVEYAYGTEVVISVWSATGEQLWKTSSYTFPVSVNLTGITSDYGTVRLEYMVTGESTTTTDPETGEVITNPGDSSTRTEERTVYFTLGE